MNPPATSPISLPALKRHAPILLALFMGLLLPLVIFGQIADEVRDRDPMWFDDAILTQLHLHATPPRDAGIIFLTRLGAARVIVPFSLLVLAAFWFRKQKAEALFFLLAAGGAMLLSPLAKAIFQRERPALWPSPAPEFDFGFPSGHSMATMGVVAALVVICWPTRWRYLALVLGAFFVVIIGFTRLYLGVHYPTDVLGGWCAALIWVSGVKAATWGREYWTRRKGVGQAT